MNLQSLKSELKSIANEEKAAFLSRYFKAGNGEYGQGDKFLGITVPQQRNIAKKYVELEFKGIQKLLSSKIHEHRYAAFLILIEKYRKTDKNEKNSSISAGKKKIFDFCIRNIKSANNWDLVDTMAPEILGDFLLERDKSLLYQLAKSKNLWERRIAIISTYTFIKKNYFADSLKIAKLLLADKHDLIHKAVGWMLREVGNRNQEWEEKFLKENIDKIPRTTLRYAIEKFSRKKRKFYMNFNKAQKIL